MAFHLLDKVALDDDATKAVFEHFRNVGVVATIEVASVWLQRHATYDSLRGLMTALAGGVLQLIVFALLQLVIMNASVRLTRAGFFEKKRLMFALWGIYLALGATGWVVYASRV